MSYLLTEIALEMLGYKFYDIYGVNGQINNFQDPTPPQSGESTNLESLLNNVLGLTAAPADPEEDNKHQDNRLNSDKAEDNREPAEKVKAPPPSPLTKLLNQEYKKVEEALRTKLEYGKQHGELSSVRQDKPLRLSQNCRNSETEKLRKEVQTIRSCRKLVEQNIVKMYPVSYEKYVRTFRSREYQSNSNLKSTNSNK